jgi:ABC-type glutathione transport system ATPase component
MRQVSSNIVKQLQNHENTNKIALEEINFDKKGFSQDLDHMIESNFHDLKISRATEKPKITTEAVASSSTPKARAGKMKLLKLKASGVVDMSNLLNSRRSEELKKEDFQAVSSDLLRVKPLVVVGPAGVGKHTLIQELLKRYPSKFKLASSFVSYHPLNI